MNDLFEVEKVKLVPQDSTFGPSKSYGMYRTDTKAYLGTVGEKYHPVQNSDLYSIIAFAADIAGIDHSEMKFKTFLGGRKVSIQIPLPDWSLKGDDVLRYVTALNSHDGSSAIGLGLVGVRVFCTNMWMQAFKTCAKIRHTASAEEKIHTLAQELYSTIEKDKDLYNLFSTMQDTSYTDLDHSKFIKELIGFDMSDVTEKDTRKIKKFNAIHDAIDYEMVSAGRNEWGLFNGVTRYTNHILGAKKEEATDFLYHGGGAKLVNRSIDILAPELLS